MLGATALSDVLLNEIAKLGINFVFVFSMSNATNKKIGTIADIDLVLFTPTDKFEVVYFHFIVQG